MYLQCLWSEQMKKILSFLTVSKGILLAGKNDIFMMKLKWDRKFLTTDALKLKSANSEVMDINRNRDAAKVIVFKDVASKKWFFWRKDACKTYWNWKMNCSILVF